MGVVGTRMKVVSGWINQAAGKLRDAHPARPYDQIVQDAISQRATVRQLPGFGPTGELPAGIHDADLGSFLLHVGSTPERRALYAPFGERLLQLQQRGVKDVIVAGSGITAKPVPGDVDALYHVADSAKLPMRERLEDWAQGTHWHGAERRHTALHTEWGTTRPTWLEYFSHRSAPNGTMRPFGTIRVHLAQAPDAIHGAAHLQPPGSSTVSFRAGAEGVVRS